MRRLITRAVRKWALREKLSESTLLAVIQELDLGVTIKPVVITSKQNRAAKLHTNLSQTVFAKNYS